MSARSKRPAHQNSTAFKHNPNSRLTARIASIPNDGLCHRCHAIIEWRKKYRKYKPLSQPRKCNECSQKTVRFAYHTRCTPCSQAKKVCAKCGEQRELVEKAGKALSGEELVRWMADMGVRERRRRLVLRQWEGGERTDDEIRELVNKYAAEAASRDGLNDDDDDWDDEDDEDGMDEDEEEERVGDEKSHKKHPATNTIMAPSTTSPTSSLSSPPQPLGLCPPPPLLPRVVWTSGICFNPAEAQYRLAKVEVQHQQSRRPVMMTTLAMMTSIDRVPERGRTYNCLLLRCMACAPAINSHRTPAAWMQTSVHSYVQVVEPIGAPPPFHRCSLPTPLLPPPSPPRRPGISVPHPAADRDSV